MALGETRAAQPPRRPRVDVGVVTWNTGDLTAVCLRRLLDTDQGCDVRLLVRDNASTDGTIDVVRRLVPEADIDLGVENLGFAGGANTLLARSRAPWFFLLNPDAWPLPGAIGSLVTTAERHPRAAAVVPRIENPDGTLQHSSHPFPSLRVAAICAFAWNRIPKERAEELLLEGAWLHDYPRRVDWAIGAAMLLRRQAVDDVGAFDERFFMYVEDLEWCWRARKHGWEIHFDSSALVRHVGNVSGSQQFGGMRTREHVRNAYVFYRREHGLARTSAWWGLNVAGTLLRLLEAIARRDRDRVRIWQEQASAHLLGMRASNARRGRPPR